MADDFEELFSKYPRPKNARSNAGGTSSNAVTKSNCRFEDITQETGFLGIVFQVYPTAETPQQQDRQEARFKEYSIILRRIVPLKQGERDPVLQLEIQSLTLRKAFRRLAEGHVNINLHRNPIILKEPYVELYHCQDQIEEASLDADDDTKDELQLLRTFRKDYMSEAIKDFESLESHGLISYDFLQYLFVPGSLVVMPNRFISPSQPLWAAVVVYCQVIKGRNENSWEIGLAYTNFNGASFGTVFSKLLYPAFADIRKIVELPVYPIKYHPQHQTVLQALETRGRNYYKLCMDFEQERQCISTGFHRYYDGSFWEVSSSTQEGTGEDHDRRARKANPREKKRSRGICDETTASLEAFCNPPSSQCVGRLVIDLAGFVEENPSFRDSVRHDNSGPSAVLLGSRDDFPAEDPFQAADADSSEDSTDRKVDIIPLQLITTPPFIPGFSLSKRTWGFVDVDHIRPIDWDVNAYENLQMGHRLKESVRRLVSAHHASNSGMDDFVTGKGKGLLFLLHGPPGSGKTMTAETVAESLHSPLYYTSGGELATGKERIEEQLQLIFQRIHRWAAILLLDEADTFMARRSEDSLERNALVSILLRMLEYQSGILFLTTNRLSDFDTAFYSRIHVCIEFERPDAQRRMFIWSKLAGKINHEISQSEFKRLGSLPLDGRRIKNVIKVASLLMHSRGDDSAMSFEDIRRSLEISAGDPSDDDAQRMIQELCT
ncbi:hypothetical protein GGR54DRAFT_634714 [Hypoxylon sp. NC1633]|nr:hypothetical protein GGR54DRAFT_634714 [Hypoxylon sp. NC1633]